jgi:hypothetical protein
VVRRSRSVAALARALVVLASIAGAGAGAGCRGGAAENAPPCSAVAAKFLDLARYDLAQAKADDATRRAVADQLPALRDSLAQVCSDGKWSPAVRGCLVAARDHVGFEACEQQLTDEQRRDLDRANRGPASGSP